MTQRNQNRLASLPKATKNQIKYIEGLLIDAGFQGRAQRNAYLSELVNREISFLDELLAGEASHVINELLLKKEALQDGRRG